MGVCCRWGFGAPVFSYLDLPHHPAQKHPITPTYTCRISLSIRHQSRRYITGGYLCTMDYFKRLLALLKIEKEEDRRTYKELTENTPLTERRAAGLTWYPVAIKDTELGHA